MKRHQAKNVAPNRVTPNRVTKTPVPDKQHIIDSIARLARKLGHTPSHAEFIAHSGISAHRIMQCFEYWNDAVRAAGLRPRKRNVSAGDRELLEDWGRHARRSGDLPTVHGYRRKGKFEPSSFQWRFGAWSKVPEAFRKFAQGKPEWADVMALLPGCRGKGTSERNWDSPLCTSPNQVQYARGLGDRPAYGNPTNFHALRHEPVNEQGVVLLFGMLAKQLGFLVEAVQNGFPDCEAKRQIAPGRWQRVSIEFEFESRNFHAHGHPLHGCDIIVCWRHNWDDCPKHIEVVELSRVIKSLANSEE